jgi:hypothetical protein
MRWKFVGVVESHSEGQNYKEHLMMKSRSRSDDCCIQVLK